MIVTSWQAASWHGAVATSGREAEFCRCRKRLRWLAAWIVPTVAVARAARRSCSMPGQPLAIDPVRSSGYTLGVKAGGKKTGVRRRIRSGRGVSPPGITP
jgi:hypothetical protein